MTAIGLLNHKLIKSIICSDCNDEALRIANQNLKLLTISGINERINHLENLFSQFIKTSHLQAIESAKTLRKLIDKDRNINTIIFNSDIFKSNDTDRKNIKADIIFTDIPYGNLVSWQNDEDIDINILLDNLMPVIKTDSIIAICSNKRQKIHSGNYIRLEKEQIGKRKFEIFTLR